MTTTPYTRIPNKILDAMQDMPEAESRLTAVLTRLTYGYHTDTARLTWDDMQAATGYASRSSVARAVEMVEARGFFRRGRKSTWHAVIRIENSTRNGLNGDVNSTPNGLNDDENSTPNGLNEDSNSTPNRPDDSPSGVLSFKEKNTPIGVKKKDGPPTPQPADPALAEMVNALVDATGQSGHLNWRNLSALAREMLDAGHTAEQVAAVYGPGGWWGTCDWRGVKGQRPGLTAVRETILQGVTWDGQVPARASPNGNGHQPTRAEAAALEYAAIKSAFRSDS